MRVKELIQKLQMKDPEGRVYFQKGRLKVVE
jgi:hypothetical protein